MREEWRDIVGYEGRYQVSNLGNVRSLNYKGSNDTRNLKPFRCGHNYLHVELRGKGFKVHRLVAMAFIPNPQNYPEVHHVNEDKHDNSVANLGWCTRRENTSYGTMQERRVANTNWDKMANYLRRSVSQLGADGNLIKVFKSMKDAEKETGIRTGNISKCCHGIVKTAGGYQWKFE